MRQQLGCSCEVFKEKIMKKNTKKNLYLRKRNGKDRWVKEENVKEGDFIFDGKIYKKVLKICPRDWKLE